jgi:hypothetical protein
MTGATQGAMTTEHILLVGDEPAPELAVAQARQVRVRLGLHDRVRRTRTELRIYDQGYLGICETRAGTVGQECRFDLRHLDPRPLQTRQVARKSGRAALGLMLVALGAATLAWLSVVPQITIPAATTATLAAVVAAVVYLKRTLVRIQFVTRHGRTVAFALVAGCGCRRACRALVPGLVAAIRDAARLTEGDRHARLRAEIREHYRLHEAGILTRDDCAVAVQRVLACF